MQNNTEIKTILVLYLQEYQKLKIIVTRQFFVVTESTKNII